MRSTGTPEIAVVGGGIAALELVLALRALAGDRVRITLIAPAEHLTVRPALVAEPLGIEPERRFAAQAFARDTGSELLQASVAAVDADRHLVRLRGGGTHAYDLLVLAPGARRLPAFEFATHLGDEEGTHGLQALRAEVARGDVRRIAFVAPTATGWLLPLYEAALLTAHAHPEVAVTLVTAEERPLGLFTAHASEAVAAALDRAGVRFLGGRHIEVADGLVIARGVATDTVPADRVFSLPLLRGPQIDGVPGSGAYELIAVDAYGLVHGLDDVYAIGDATSFPIKQGGLACLQADAAATHIAARCGADVTPERFTPVLRAVLLTGTDPIRLGGAVEKLPGRYLGPYLASVGSATAR